MKYDDKGRRRWIVQIGKIDIDAFDARVNADAILRNEPPMTTDRFCPKRFHRGLGEECYIHNLNFVFRR